MSEPLASERRGERRTTMVSWPCTYAFGAAPGARVTSEIQDFSPSGAFIAAPADACEQIGPGLTLTLYGEMWGAAFELPAEVRWVGYSMTHGRFGFGVAIDRDLSLARLLGIPPMPSP